MPRELHKQERALRQGCAEKEYYYMTIIKITIMGNIHSVCTGCQALC